MPVLENNSAVQHHRVYRDNFYNSVMLSENILQHSIRVCVFVRVCLCVCVCVGGGGHNEVHHRHSERFGGGRRSEERTVACHNDVPYDSRIIKRKHWGKESKGN